MRILRCRPMSYEFGDEEPTDGVAYLENIKNNEWWAKKRASVKRILIPAIGYADGRINTTTETFDKVGGYYYNGGVSMHWENRTSYSNRVSRLSYYLGSDFYLDNTFVIKGYTGVLFSMFSNEIFFPN